MHREIKRGRHVTLRLVWLEWREDNPDGWGYSQPLRFGPAWFRTASMTVGPAVVVGSLLVHTDGVDFRILHPVWLAVALFVALPGLFAYAMVAVGDRWLREDSCSAPAGGPGWSPWRRCWRSGP